MKIATIILSLILITLSAMPCADSNVLVATKATVKMLADNGGHDEQHHTDQCSPFCVCSCCGVQILTFSATPMVEIVMIAEISVKKEIHYTSTFAGSFSVTIWQPPQIA